MEFAEGLKAVMKRRGVTPSALAQTLKISYVTVWAWRVGRNFPTPALRRDLAAMFPELAPLLSAPPPDLRGKHGRQGKAARAAVLKRQAS